MGNAIDDLPDDVLLHIFKHRCGMDPEESIGSRGMICMSLVMNLLGPISTNSLDRWKRPVNVGRAWSNWMRTLVISGTASSGLISPGGQMLTLPSQSTPSRNTFQRQRRANSTFSLFSQPELVEKCPFGMKSDAHTTTTFLQALKMSTCSKLLLEAIMKLLPRAHRIRMLHISACMDILTKFIFPFLSLLQPAARRLEFLHIDSLDLFDYNQDSYRLSPATFDIQPLKEGFTHLHSSNDFKCSALRSLTQLKLWDISGIAKSFSSASLQNVIVKTQS
ncbi:hypothetical protein C8J56DRAFT_1160696, partial [Mycena floridula]